MVRRSSSSSLQWVLDKKGMLIGLCACLLLFGCASTPPPDFIPERWPDHGADNVSPYLLALREYLALPIEQKSTHRDRLRAAAEEGDSVAALQHALVLSVDRDDRASLERAQEHLEQLLAVPEPLPVAVDALVRLQLGQVIDRLERMQASGDIHHAYRATADEWKVCRVELAQRTEELENLHEELFDVRRKLDALARIERTVNEQQPRNDVSDRERQ